MTRSVDTLNGETMFCELCGAENDCVGVISNWTTLGELPANVAPLLGVAPRYVSDITRAAPVRKHGDAVAEFEGQRGEGFNAAFRILEFIACDLDAPRHFRDPLQWERAHPEVPAGARHRIVRGPSFEREVKARVKQAQATLDRREMKTLKLNARDVADDRSERLRHIAPTVSTYSRLHWRTLAERIGFYVPALEETLRLWRKQRFNGMSTLRIAHIDLVKEFASRLDEIGDVPPDVHASFAFIIRHARSTNAPRQDKEKLQLWLSALRAVSRSARLMLETLYKAKRYDDALRLIRTYVRASHTLHVCPGGCDCGAARVCIGGQEALALHTTLGARLHGTEMERLQQVWAFEDEGHRPYVRLRYQLE